MVSLIDKEGEQRGELVWRVASGQTVEICEFGIHREGDRQQGWGTRLLNNGIADMEAFYGTRMTRMRSLLRVWLLAEARNEIGRSFYEASGFVEATTLKDFYSDDDAVIYLEAAVDVRELRPSGLLQNSYCVLSLQDFLVGCILVSPSEIVLHRYTDFFVV